MKLKDFISVYENKKNKQVKFEIKKKKLKEFDMELKDIINSPINKKIKEFKK